MLQRRLALVALVVVLLAMFATVAIANILKGATATVNCGGYNLTVSAIDLTPGIEYTIKYSFTGTCLPTSPFPGTITFTATGSTATEVASGTWSLTADCTVTGSATLTSSGSEVPITFNGNSSVTLTTCAPPPPACSTGPQSLLYNVSEQSSNASEIVWFNSHFKLQGTVPTTDFKVNVTNQTITFGPSTLPVPNAVVTFTSTVSCASTSFNTTTNEWETFIPLSDASHADEIFSAGLAHILPASFPQNVNNVTWHVTFTSTAPSLQFQFQYGAANYLSKDNKGDVFPLTASGQPDYNAMMVNPVHNAPTCNGYNNGDHAGTPEDHVVKDLVTGGGSGGGGSNWTGSWSSTPTYVCAAP
jgi:hypothetical protein